MRGKSIRLSLLLSCLLALFGSADAFSQSSGDNAQHSAFKKERRVYLWDVTLSMKGDGAEPSPNIWDKVKGEIIRSIENVVDPQTELIVVPFQETVLETWSYTASADGKRELINKVKDFDTNKRTWTNIVVPFTYAQNELLKDDRRNVLFLMTDGVQNTGGTNDNTAVPGLIDKWCEFAQKHDAYAFYVKLVKSESAKDKEHDNLILESINKSCNIYWTEGTDIDFCELRPSQRVLLNVKDDVGKNLTLGFEANRDTKDVRLRVWSTRP